MVTFPLYNTKKLSSGKVYNLNDPTQRYAYFQAKIGDKIEDLKNFLDNKTFVSFLVAKKSAGKGTYSKLFQEIVGSDRVALVSVGDVVRKVHKMIQDSPSYKDELLLYMEKSYRGVISMEDAFNAFVNRDQSTLIPTEFILALLKREIDSIGKKAVFIDGFPRDFNQVSYSLYLRDLINYRDDPDFFVFIDVPETVLDERMKTRVVCPLCNTSRSIKLLPTAFVRYDKSVAEGQEKGQSGYYLLCDNKECLGYGSSRLVSKEGDSAGIESIRGRLDTDGKLIDYATQIYGIPKVLIRNTIPLERSEEMAESYEITPMYSYEGAKGGEVVTKESPWVFKDDVGVDSVSLLAAPVVVSMIDQIHAILL